MTPDIRVNKNVLEGLTKLGVPYQILASSSEKTTQESLVQSGPEIIIPSDRWLIKVSHQGKAGIYELSQKMLPSMNFKDTINYSINARTQGKFSPRDSRFNFSAFRSVVDSNSTQKDKIISFLKNNLRKYFSLTTTLVVYNYNGNRNDKFVHHAGMKEQYEIPVKIIGPDQEITSEDNSFLEAMVDCSDFEKVKRVTKVINNTLTFIYRINSAPKSCEKKVARFGASSSWLFLGACRDLDCEDPSFGYKLVEQDK